MKSIVSKAALQSSFELAKSKVPPWFLSNEIRAEGIEVIIHERICEQNNTNCKIKKKKSKLESEKENIEYSETGPGRQEPSKY